MGANAQTSVPTFTAGEVLTAANMNISARTGIPVFADATARDAAFGGTGEKTLAEGQFAYLESTNATQYYDGAAWQAVGASSGLTLVSATTIGTTVASVTVSSAFSATYDNYKIIISGGVGSAGGNLGLQLGATTTAYYHNLIYGAYAGGGILQLTVDNGSSFSRAGTMSTDFISFNVDISNPFLSKFTYIQNNYIFTDSAGFGAGYQGSTTSFTAFTLTPSTGTLTGGTIRVYGYANS